MTAEIAVLNRFGVALAADSAVTVGSYYKIFNTAQKLFSLSKEHSVGIMIYGNANFMNIPWETVVQLYKRQMANRTRPQLIDYCNDFMQFINTEPRFTSPEAERYLVGRFFSSWLEDFLKQLNEYVNTNYTHEPTIEEMQEVLLEGTNEAFSQLNSADFHNTFDEEYFGIFEVKYGSFINEIFGENVNIEPTEEIIGNLILIAASLICKQIPNDNESGIVIAGYGEDDIFPSLYAYNISGIFDGNLKYRESEKSEIGNLNSAQIVPFAQQEMVHAFLTGMDPNLESQIYDFLMGTVGIYPDFVSSLLGSLDEETKASIEDKGRELLQEFTNEIQKLKRRKHINPIIQTVAAFPKDELAAMAEALVNLTSIKRKVTNQAETVGGPIDVAVISKGDGFIWVKRKQYFSAELNT